MIFLKTILIFIFINLSFADEIGHFEYFDDEFSNDALNFSKNSI